MLIQVLISFSKHILEVLFANYKNLSINVNIKYEIIDFSLSIMEYTSY